MVAYYRASLARVQIVVEALVTERRFDTRLRSLVSGER